MFPLTACAPVRQEGLVERRAGRRLRVLGRGRPRKARESEAGTEIHESLFGE